MRHVWRSSYLHSTEKSPHFIQLFEGCKNPIKRFRHESMTIAFEFAGSNFRYFGISRILPIPLTVENDSCIPRNIQKCNNPGGHCQWEGGTLTYCWWKESTSWYGKYPSIYRALYIPGGDRRISSSTVSSHGTIDCPPRILNLFVSAIIYRWKDTRRDAEEFSITGDVDRRDGFRSPQLVVKWPKNPGLGTVLVCPDLYSPENEGMSRENQWLGVGRCIFY